MYLPLSKSILSSAQGAVPKKVWVLHRRYDMSSETGEVQMGDFNQQTP